MVEKFKNTLTISFSSFNVISEETLSSWDPFKFRLVLDGLVFSSFGLLAGIFVRNRKKRNHSNIVKSRTPFSVVPRRFDSRDIGEERSKRREGGKEQKERKSRRRRRNEREEAAAVALSLENVMTIIIVEK